MAIVDDVLVAVARQDHPSRTNWPSQTDEPDVADKVRISIQNIDSDRYPPHQIVLADGGEIDIDSTILEWSNYFKAGIKGALTLIHHRRSNIDPHTNPLTVSFDALVDGTVPAAAGLSSSSALVCASTLATLRVNGIEAISRLNLVEAAITAERHGGVSSGGMDQAASILSHQGSALYVGFYPKLQASPVKLPATTTQYTFLIAQSFVEATKHTTGPYNYNLRVVECTIAAHLLFSILGLKGGLKPDSSPLGTSLRGFHEAYFEQVHGRTAAQSESAAGLSIEQEIRDLTELATLVDDYFVQMEGYSRDELAALFGTTVAEINSRFCARFPVQADRFRLRQRALHVFNEARRVKQFYNLVQSANDGRDSAFSEVELLEKLGELMNESQSSCRDLYQNSCPELDQLCQIARREGAFGSRLTGAGFGGSTVHLVPRDKVEAIKKAWKDEYYAVLAPELANSPDIDLEHWRGAVVDSQPEAGASIVCPST